MLKLTKTQTKMMRLAHRQNGVVAAVVAWGYGYGRRVHGGRDRDALNGLVKKGLATCVHREMHREATRGNSTYFTEVVIKLNARGARIASTLGES